MTAGEYEELIDETFEHLEQGRYRMALTSAKKVYGEFPEDYKSAVCFAWALLENGNAADALELADIAVKLSDNDLYARTYRGYILTRMSLYEGALSDLDYVIKNNTSLRALAIKSKATALAATGKFEEAGNILRTELLSHPEVEKSFSYLLSLIRLAIESSDSKKAESNWLITAQDALKAKEYWFSLLASQRIIKEGAAGGILRKALFFELDSLFHLFRLKEALARADSVKDVYAGDADFNQLYEKLFRSNSEGKILFPVETKELKGLTEAKFYPETGYKVYSIKTFNYLDRLHNEKRIYLLQFNEDINYIGVEVILNNPYYQKRAYDISGTAVWLLNNNEVGRNRFVLSVQKDWKTVEFVQNWGTSSEGFWTKGQGQVDIYLEEKKLCTRYFLVGARQIINFENDASTSGNVSAVSEERKTKSYIPSIDEDLLSKSLEELNRLTGLAAVKKEVNEMVKLAKFFIEQEENLADNFQSHFVFLGNPGTGKTTVARLFSKIYCALGILPRGHLVETDRQGLVGVYVGETAQKTAELINHSVGGTLFIDEAYTLSRNGSAANTDFGNEAIETLLKRMEDERGKFLVIAAGYTDQMHSFLESNPGLQSRFTKQVFFDDFSPQELLQITLNLLDKKNYTISPEASVQLLNYYNKIFRERDKSFGNARVVRDSVDIILKNHLLRIADIPPEDRTVSKLKEISEEDVKTVIARTEQKTPPKIQGDVKLLDHYLEELSELAGLESVKSSVRKLVGSLKVSKLREEKGLKVIPRNLHSVFTGNPGTGKTTIARLLSKIYKEMGILEKGHLVEIDRSGLVAGYQGQTAIKTDAVIQRALGGTLFIDEAYSLSRGSNDFGLEAIDTLIKRMEDYQGKFVVIVAGYTDEMKEFIQSNPGLKSRFINYYNFEDYTPRQLLEIALVITGKHGYNPDEGAWQLLLDIFTEFCRKKVKNSGNARMVRNILYKAISNQEERILAVYNPDAEDLCTIKYEDVASIDLTEF